MVLSLKDGASLGLSVSVSNHVVMATWSLIYCNFHRVTDVL